MALSNLKEYGKKDFFALNIVPFARSVGVSSTGAPDDKVEIKPVGWVGKTQFAFTVIAKAFNGSALSIDATATNTLNVDLTGKARPTRKTTYWTVDTGTGNEESDQWMVQYEIEREKKKTGKWVFVKGT